MDVIWQCECGAYNSAETMPGPGPYEHGYCKGCRTEVKYYYLWTKYQLVELDRDKVL